MVNRNTSFSTILKNKWILWSLILAITIIWGYSFVIMKAALIHMGPFTFAASRFSIGSSVLLLLIWIFKMGLPPKRYWKHLIIVGILQTSIVFLLIMFALRYVDAGKSSVLLYSMPMWSSLLAAKFLGEKLTPAKFIGLSMGMIGLLAILGTDIWIGQNIASVFGEVLIVIAAVSWAIANVYYRLNLEKLPKLQASAFQMTFGTIGILIAALFTEWSTPMDLNMHSIYYILFTGILASALCFTVWFIILSMIDMVTATVSILLVPVFGLLFSVLILGEKLTVSVSIGSGLIIFGIIIAQLTRKQGSS